MTNVKRLGNRTLEEKVFNIIEPVLSSDIVRDVRRNVDLSKMLGAPEACGYEADIYIVTKSGKRLDVECDNREQHGRGHDKRKDDRLRDIGIYVIRVLDYEVSHPDSLQKRVAAALKELDETGRLSEEAGSAKRSRPCNGAKTSPYPKTRVVSVYVSKDAAGKSVAVNAELRDAEMGRKGWRPKGKPLAKALVGFAGNDPIDIVDAVCSVLLSEIFVAEILGSHVILDLGGFKTFKLDLRKKDTALRGLYQRLEESSRIDVCIKNAIDIRQPGDERDGRCADLSNNAKALKETLSRLTGPEREERVSSTQRYLEDGVRYASGILPPPSRFVRITVRDDEVFARRLEHVKKIEGAWFCKEKKAWYIPENVDVRLLREELERIK